MQTLKPKRGTILNTANPLSYGLIACWLMNEKSIDKVYDLSKYQNHLTAYNTPTIENGRFGYSVNFDDAASEYLQIDLPIVLMPFTVVAWVCSNDDTINQCIFSMADTLTDLEIFYFALYGGAAGDYVWVLSQDGGGWRYAISTRSFVQNKWHQVAAVFKNTTWRAVYVDGADEQINEDYSNPDPSKLDTTSVGRLSRLNPTAYFSGKIDHEMVWNRALSAEEIAHLYREPFCMFREKTSPAWQAVAPPAEITGVFGSLSSELWWIKQKKGMFAQV